MMQHSILNQALALHQTGRLEEAERLYLELIREYPHNAGPHHLLGVMRAQQGRNEEASKLIEAALKISPDSPEILSNYGNVLKALGHFDKSLAAFDQALAIKPDYAAVMARRGMVLRDLGRLNEALSATDAALSQRALPVEAYANRGAILSDLGRHDEALASYDRAIALAPASAGLWNNRALTLKAMRRLDEALVHVQRALKLDHGFAEAWNNQGIILFELKRTGEALDSYDRALRIRRNYAEAWNNRAATLASLKHFGGSLTACDQALELKPDFADALYNRGNALSELNRQQEALESYQKALDIDPVHPSAISGMANAALMIGDWDLTAKLAKTLKEDVLAGTSLVQPFVLMGYHDDNALQLLCCQNYVRRAGPGPVPPLWTGQKYNHDKVRIAYLSADFHQHVTAALTVEMFERHDRSHFEVIAVSFGPDDESAIRRRLIKAFDHFHDASALTDQQVAILLRQWEIDIAVDIGGHTNGARPWVLAHRPAPVQAKYMGYPGTSGADFIDYLIADRTVVPEDQDCFFSEKIIALPDTLWVTDTTAKLAQPPTRAAVGLPENAFVFCCFNHNWKITAALFDIWMRLLQKVDDSVLWLLQGNDSIVGNLRRNAAKRGIDPKRLIFAERTTPDAHLARQQLADLFLDTLPYNAHTTASDALWVGLPVVTTPGKSLPARVAASILRAASLPELIAPDLQAYEALALQLARAPDELQIMRRKLHSLRNIAPLFDTVRFTRNLEAAYLAMLDRR